MQILKTRHGPFEVQASMCMLGEIGYLFRL